MQNFSLLNYDVEMTAAEKATKRDDAEVPEHLWNYCIAYLLGTKTLDATQQRALNRLRTTLLARWKRNVLHAWRWWWMTARVTINDKILRDLLWERGVLACDHALQATFWLWPKGSGIFFWRWPLEYLLDVAIGVPPFWIDKPDEKITRQKNLGDQELIKKITEKLNNVCAKGYIGPGRCVATMNFFAVPKGDSDIRMVYDGTKSGLNKCLYAPWFPLPDGNVLVNTSDDSFWCIDNNYGEMFLNFWLHPDLQLYSGMDFTLMYGCRNDRGLWTEVWNHCPMGQSPSPYSTVQQTRRLKRLIYGNRYDSTNIFSWSCIHLNLPGTPSYHPGVPWLSKRRPDGIIAADAHDYVDDLRGCAATEEDAWRVGSRVAMTASFYGVQDAAHKRRQQAQRPGAWAGVVCGTSPDRPFVSITQEKWDRTKL